MKVEVLLFVGAGAQNRPGTRRMTELQKQMVHYNPSYNIVKHFAYGCNCNMFVGDRPMSQPGAGQPLDDLDATCKNYRSCQECVTDEYGATCIGEFTLYNWSETSFTCTDAPGTCERAICECDAQFAKAHSAKSDLYNQNFSHVFAAFAFSDVCPNICGKNTFTVSNTEAYDIDAHFNGEYLGAHKLVNGRKCYRQNDSLIQWEIDSDGIGRWVMRDNVGVKAYSRTDTPCPTTAAWSTIAGGAADGILFNGLARGIIPAGPPADPQCCTPSNGPFTPFNAATHVCCTDGSVTPHGNC